MSTWKYIWAIKKTYCVVVNVLYLAPVLLDVVGRLSEASVQSNIGKVLSIKKSKMIWKNTIRKIILIFIRLSLTSIQEFLV